MDKNITQNLKDQTHTSQNPLHQGANYHFPCHQLCKNYTQISGGIPVHDSLIVLWNWKDWSKYLYLRFFWPSHSALIWLLLHMYWTQIRSSRLMRKKRLSLRWVLKSAWRASRSQLWVIFDSGKYESQPLHRSVCVRENPSNCLETVLNLVRV